jgi:hypothetical protein
MKLTALIRVLVEAQENNCKNKQQYFLKALDDHRSWPQHKLKLSIR